ncbi:hypothetical protein AURDEDRAFT_125340 [Auricularia subglabra TFB-10046 SS5]|nr:hypothetical protein AURDEDRAFT_125340 [Auricularia subglabra TFB-10046 SS5]
MLYNLYHGALSEQCQFFEELFEHADPGEGTSDANPVVVNRPGEIAPATFEKLMQHMFTPSYTHVRFERDYRDLMVLAHFYRNQSLLEQFARRHEVCVGTLTPMQRLDLAVRFSLTHWKLDAINKLLEFPFIPLSPADIANLSSVRRTTDTPDNCFPNLYSVIAHARAEISVIQFQLVNLGVPVRCSKSCSLVRHERCVAAWTLYWHVHVVPVLFSDKPPQELEDAENLLAHTPDLLSMNEDCQAAHIAKLQGLGVLEQAFLLRDDMVALAMTYNLS